MVCWCPTQRKKHKCMTRKLGICSEETRSVKEWKTIVFASRSSTTTKLSRLGIPSLNFTWYLTWRWASRGRLALLLTGQKHPTQRKAPTLESCQERALALPSHMLLWWNSTAWKPAFKTSTYKRQWMINIGLHAVQSLALRKQENEQ